MHRISANSYVEGDDDDDDTSKGLPWDWIASAAAVCVVAIIAARFFHRK